MGKRRAVDPGKDGAFDNSQLQAAIAIAHNPNHRA
jgi:hypothetical protein